MVLIADEIGCPSGLQERPVSETDPFGAEIDLSDSVLRRKDGTFEMDLIIQGAHCAGCVNKIERHLKTLSGVTRVRMNLTTLKLNIAWDSDDLTPPTLIKALADLGYGAAPYEITAAQDKSKRELTNLLRAMAVAGFASVNIMLLSIAVWAGHSEMQVAIQSGFHWLSAMIALPTVAYSGRPFFRSAWAAVSKRQTNMDVPISLAVILACTLSVYETINNNPDTYFDAAVMLLFLLLIGRYLDAKLRLKTGAAAQKLAALQATSATRVLPDGQLETIPARKVEPGDTLLIPAGQRIPVDAKIISGQSEIDVHIATGESVPKLAGIGDDIYSGTINITSPLTVRAIAAHHDSFLSEISQLVEIGEQGRSQYMRIADKAARAYVPVVHSLALLTFFGWLAYGAGLRPAALNAIAVLIITCPCALGLAVPAVQIVASGSLFKNGILIKSGDALERLAQIRSIIFDKTGTLTKGEFALLNHEDISNEALQSAAALSRYSRHPLAKALQIYDNQMDVSDVNEIAGQGIQGNINGRKIRFGKAAFVGLGASEDKRGSWLRLGEDEPIHFDLEDQLRDDAKSTLEALHNLGLSVELLSGDTKQATRVLSETLGIERFKGDVTPKQKQDIIYQRLAEGRQPLMVGDGINDAPALACAHASASLATASDISRSASDIILQGDKLSSLPFAVQTARMARRRIVENLGLAIIYNMLAIPLAVFGLVNPLIAALAMSVSSLLVTLNALRMRRA